MEDQREDVRELIQALKERLKWYQEEATEEEIDPEEINAILALLEKWEKPAADPLEVSDAYSLFCEHYLKAAGMPRPARRKVYRILRQAAAAVIVVSILFAVLNLGAYAAAGQDFFSLLWQRDGEKSFVAMGGDTSKEGLDVWVDQDTYYSSWEELPQELLNQIYVPMYIPEGLELSSLRYQTDRNAGTARAVYGSLDGENRLKIWIEHYGDVYTWQQDLGEGGEKLTEQKIGEMDCYWEEQEEELMLYFFKGEELYTLQSNLSKQEMEKIVENMHSPLQK